MTNQISAFLVANLLHLVFDLALIVIIYPCYQDARSELKTCSAELQRLTDENASLVRQLIETRQQVSSLETLNFSLEEQLMEMSAASGEGGEGGGEGGGRRKRGYTRILLESEVAEKDKVGIT